MRALGRGGELEPHNVRIGRALTDTHAPRSTSLN
jgi:hypothetical protein